MNEQQNQISNGIVTWVIYFTRIFKLDPTVTAALNFEAIDGTIMVVDGMIN